MVLEPNPTTSNGPVFEFSQRQTTERKRDERERERDEKRETRNEKTLREREKAQVPKKTKSEGSEARGSIKLYCLHVHLAVCAES